MKFYILLRKACLVVWQCLFPDFISFYAKSSLAKKQDMKLYVKRILKQYLLWSGVYVPYALAYFWTLPVQKHYAPLALLAGLLYIGLCYQLWYIPAFLLGLLLVHFLYKKLGPKKTFVLLLVLYALGAIETYHAYLAPSLLTDWYDAYAKLFLLAEMVSSIRLFLSI